MDIVIGVTQCPVIQLVTVCKKHDGNKIFFPSGLILLTRNAARLAGILAAGRVYIAGEHLSVQHKVWLEGDLDNDKLKSPLNRHLMDWQWVANGNGV